MDDFPLGSAGADSSISGQMSDWCEIPPHDEGDDDHDFNRREIPPLDEGDN